MSIDIADVLMGVGLTLFIDGLIGTIKRRCYHNWGKWQSESVPLVICEGGAPASVTNVQQRQCERCMFIELRIARAK